ncbi:phospholipase D-like domain-containing protein [Pseudomonas aeruginosa]|uniref:phospholipase D-like domain-containing protein n=1 Tax=Pseudomonas aeruginosa TaxID=287 RepID=UPI00053E48D3|nr:phospholipase D-like domain-containing protein [Pseudomonas aeruginosa]
MDFDGLDRQLRDSLADLKLSNEERDELRQLGSELAPDQVRFLRNRAFDLVRELVLLEGQGERIAALKWLEQVVRTLEVTAAPPRSRASAYFSPGEECRRKIRELCRQARQSLDICVFTISDDQLSAEILACHRRGVPVRIISDDDKQFDEGSDIHALREAGVPLRIDDSPFHMHHKFALVDGAWLLNGSFNWTRSASVNNEENLLVTDDAVLIGAYRREFEELWGRYAPR